MNTTNTNTMFNINPLVIEIEEVIKNGLNKILSDYMDRYILLENTHKQIMNLPSVRQELYKGNYETTPEYENNNISDTIKSKLESLENRFNLFENNYRSISPILSKILDKMIMIDDDVKALKKKNADTLNNTCKLENNDNENIKIQFEEPSKELNEDECDESDSDDINPALITCSDIILNKNLEKVEEEDEDEDEDEELSVGEELGEHEEPNIEVKNSVPVDEDESEDNAEDESEGDVEDVKGKPESDVKAVEEEEVEEEEVEEEVDEEEEEVEEEEVEEVEDEKDEEEVEEETEEEEEVEENASIETETNLEEEDEEIEEESKPEQIIEEKSPSNEEEEEDLFEIEIDDKTYCTNDEENGFIWELTEDGEQGEKIGYLKDGDAYFYEDDN